MTIYKRTQSMPLQRAVGDVGPQRFRPIRNESALTAPYLRPRMRLETGSETVQIPYGRIYNSTVGERVVLVQKTAGPRGFFKVPTPAINAGNGDVQLVSGRKITKVKQATQESKTVTVAKHAETKVFVPPPTVQTQPTGCDTVYTKDHLLAHTLGDGTTELIDNTDPNAPSDFNNAAAAAGFDPKAAIAAGFGF